MTSFLSLSVLPPFPFFLQSRKSRTRDRTLSSSGEQTSSLTSSSGRPDLADHSSSSGTGGGAGANPGTGGGGGGGAAGGGGASRSSKKKKKKMQKVNPAAMLGFTVNAADRPNMGEIQSVCDPK